MDTALWIVQGLLALVFLMAGGMKAMRTKEQIGANPRMGWVNDYTESQLKQIGIVELLGAIGLILPPVTGILPWLSPLAAVGLAVTMAVATRVHMRRSEPLVPTIVLLLLALFVAYGRFVLEPFA